MSDEKEPEDEIALFERKVARMREMGVLEWGNIKLGPLPPKAPPAPSAKEQQENAAKELEKKRDIMFAASHLRPSLKLVSK